MLQFYAKPFLEADRLVTQLLVATTDQNVHSFHPATLEHMQTVLATLVEQLSAMDLRMSRLSAERILARLPDAPAPATLNREVGSLWERLRDEVETVFLLHLPEHERKM